MLWRDLQNNQERTEINFITGQGCYIQYLFRHVHNSLRAYPEEDMYTMPGVKAIGLT